MQRAPPAFAGASSCKPIHPAGGQGDARTQRRGVFTDAAGEDQRVDAPRRGGHAGQLAYRRFDKVIDGQARTDELVADKVQKNHRKTLGLLRDLQGAKSVGVIAEHPALGLTEIARPVGVVCAITPSTNPAATPANKIINALKGRNAVIVAPSPKGWRTAARLIEHIHAELGRIVDASGDIALAASRILRSKTFDNATSCSSENSLVLVGAAIRPMLAALAARGAVPLDAAQNAQLQALMWPAGKLSAAATGQSAADVARRAGLHAAAALAPTMLLVEEDGFGADHPFSGEKLSPVLAVYSVPDFDAAVATVRQIYAWQGADHSVGLHTRQPAQALRLGTQLPVSRVIVDQAHCIATGGSVDNGLPFSLSMGCGTWGGNNFSDNMTYKHCLNITRISRPITERVPTEQQIFGSCFAKYGRG